MANSRQGGKVLLTVDLSYQCYRAAAAHPMLTCRDVFTGGLYGFLVTMAKIVRETQATHMVICQDRKPYLRSKAYPDYKLLRKKSADDELLKRHKQSMALILDLLEMLDYPVWGIDGFESDDLAAHAAIQNRHRFDWVFAATNDSDAFQLLWIPNFGIYSKDLASVMTGKKLMQAQGLTPDEFMLMTALTGTHNDVAGIPKVGPVTAKNAIANPALMRSLRDSHGDVIDRNLGLIKLPHPEFPRIAKMPRWAGGFDQRAFIRHLARYDIDVTMSMVNAFEQLDPQQ